MSDPTLIFTRDRILFIVFFVTKTNKTPDSKNSVDVLSFFTVVGKDVETNRVVSFTKISSYYKTQGETL